MTRLALALIAFWAVAYLLAAFVFWSINPAHWGIEARFTVVMMGSVVSPIIAGVVAVSGLCE